MRLDAYREKVRRRAGVATGDQLITPALIDDVVNQALQQIDGEAMWPWLETSATLTLVAGTTSYALPTDFRKAKGTIVLIGATSGRTELVEVSAISAFVADPTMTGRPSGYAIDGDSVVFTPTPDAAYTARLGYYRTTLELVDDADTPLLPDQWHGAVVAIAVGLLVTPEKGSRSAKEVADIEAANWIRRMRSSLRRSTGTIIPRVRPGGWV